MKTTYSWEISDALWEKVEPIIPRYQRPKGKKYQRRAGGGRKPIDPRKVFAAIVYVLRTGCQWKALPKERFGSASSVHKYFQEWKRQGVFVRLWRKGLAEYDELKGIAWAWQSIDGAMVKAPLAVEEVGPNPTDRGKKWNQAQHSGRRQWNPAVVCRQRSPAPRCEAVEPDTESPGDKAP
jgi:transposase